MFPQWIDTNEEYVTCLSDDIDSLVSCKLLEKYKGWEVGYFYNFKEIYKGTTKKVTKNGSTKKSAAKPDKKVEKEEEKPLDLFSLLGGSN